MFCSKCGNPIEEIATVCTHCGQPVANSYEKVGKYGVYEAKIKASSRGLASIILGAIGIAGAWLIALLGYALGGVGLGLSISALRLDKGCTKAKVGLALSIAALAFAALSSILAVLIALGIIKLQ